MIKFNLKKNSLSEPEDKKIPTRKEFENDIINRPDLSLLSRIDYQNFSAYSGIKSDNTTIEGMRYMLIEPELAEGERKILDYLKKMLMGELKVDLREIKNKETERLLKKKMVHLVQKNKIQVSDQSLSKILYYAVRDFAHLGKIEPLMHDPMIEEISCDGTNIQLYVFHKQYGSMPTNIIFENAEELESFVRKLAIMTSRHVSTVEPILDGRLPDGSKVSMTLGNKITKRGSTFNIKLFRQERFTIIDLLKFNTLSAELAAYLWFLVEKKMTIFVAGETASGKTTTLNAITSFIPPELKVVTIEDTQELKISHENWIPTVSRQTFSGGNRKETGLIDLLRSAIGQRPDAIVLGEIGGKEAYVLFEAISSGPCGFSSIIADSVESTITRLTSPPMEVPKELITNTLDAILFQVKTKIGDRPARRISQISEIDGLDPISGQVLLKDVFVWDANTDKHNFAGQSALLDKISKKFGLSKEIITEELNKRKTFLQWMIENEIQSYESVNKNLRRYYMDIEKNFETLDSPT